VKFVDDAIRIDSSFARDLVRGSVFSADREAVVGMEITVDGASREVEVKVTATDNSGRGWRWWWCCPKCGHRRLYLYVDGAGLSCRRCLGMRYVCQRFDEKGRRRK
jgi:hypothetical protein